MYSFKALIRDKMVEDVTIRALLGATNTGSAWVRPIDVMASAVYPQILYKDTDGAADIGLPSQNGTLSIIIQSKLTGTTDPMLNNEEIGRRVMALFNDTSLSATAPISGNVAVAFHLIRAGGTEFYDDGIRVYNKVINFDYKIKEE